MFLMNFLSNVMVLKLCVGSFDSSVDLYDYILEKCFPFEKLYIFLIKIVSLSVLSH